jgi:mRNA capping enzyme
METTSIVNSWKKETAIPLIKKASKLRNAIGWLIKKESNLAKSIFPNLSALTGEDWSNSVSDFSRTGSALHRFSCSRQRQMGSLQTAQSD